MLIDVILWGLSVKSVIESKSGMSFWFLDYVSTVYILYQNPNVPQHIKCKYAVLHFDFILCLHNQLNCVILGSAIFAGI